MSDEWEELGPIQQLGSLLAVLVVSPIVALYGFKASGGFLGFLGEIHNGEIRFAHPIFEPIVWLIVVVFMLFFAVVGIAGAFFSVASLVMLVAMPFVGLKRVLTGDHRKNGTRHCVRSPDGQEDRLTPKQIADSYQRGTLTDQFLVMYRGRWLAVPEFLQDIK